MAFEQAGKLVLATFSVLLGAFADIAFAPHVNGQYYPVWNGAAWIGPREPASMGYFRKELILDSIPIRADIKIAAPDSFRLYVNGSLIRDPRTPWAKEETAVMVSASTSATFAIAPYLRAGKNVIAIQVVLQTIPAQPRLIVDGSWQARGGSVHRILTDRTWRVAVREEWQAGRTILWHGLGFRDLDWPLAVQFDEPKRPTQYLDIPPGLLRDFPRGDWIWSRDRTAQRAAFRRTFNLQGERINHAWIGISSDAAYTLSINGLVLAAKTTEWARTTSSNMDSYNVARYLRWGENSVTLGMARTPPQSAPRLAVALIADVDGKQFDFSSDGRWFSRSDIPAGSAWTPAEVAAPMGIVPLVAEARALSPVQFGYPSVRILEISPPLGWWVKKTASIAAWCLAVLSANLVLVWLAGRVGGRRMSEGISGAWGLWSCASAAGVLLLCFLFLLQFDVRVPQAAVFQPLVFFAVWGMTLLWVGASLLVLRNPAPPGGSVLEPRFNG